MSTHEQKVRLVMRALAFKKTRALLVLAMAVAGLAVTSSTATAAPVALVSSVAPAEIENYLLAHRPYSHTSAMQGIAPYGRSVADERRAARE